MPWLTVARNVGFGLSGRSPGARDAAVAIALGRIGLADAGGLLPKQLLLLDEPFSALDPFTREQMQDHLLHLHRHYGTTIVLITHDMDEALTLADRIIVLRGGPGSVAADVTPASGRPRSHLHPDVAELRTRLTTLLTEA